MIKSNYEVEILVNGHAVKEYFKDGKIYVEARDGNRFSIKIKNNGYKRILAVPSVDGLSVMNGKTASLSSGGYIVKGYSSITIDGWRTSNDSVSEFFFTNPDNSYAVKKKNGSNVGVIGVAIFREKEPEPIMAFQSINIPNSWQCSSQGLGITSLSVSGSSASINYCASGGTRQDVGTGFGESKQSNVVTVDFQEESSPDAVFEVFYNSRKQLEKLGIDFKTVQYVTPQAFPGQFCEPPTN